MRNPGAVGRVPHIFLVNVIGREVACYSSEAINVRLADGLREYRLVSDFDVKRCHRSIVPDW